MKYCKDGSHNRTEGLSLCNTCGKRVRLIENSSPSAFCKFCKGVLKLLGILGRREYAQCTACGIVEARPAMVLNVEAAELLQ